MPFLDVEIPDWLKPMSPAEQSRHGREAVNRAFDNVNKAQMDKARFNHDMEMESMKLEAQARQFNQRLNLDTQLKTAEIKHWDTLDRLAEDKMQMQVDKADKLSKDAFNLSKALDGVTNAGSSDQMAAYEPDTPFETGEAAIRWQQAKTSIIGKQLQIEKAQRQQGIGMGLAKSFEAIIQHNPALSDLALEGLVALDQGNMDKVTETMAKIKQASIEMRSPRADMLPAELRYFVEEQWKLLPDEQKTPQKFQELLKMAQSKQLLNIPAVVPEQNGTAKQKPQTGGPSSTNDLIQYGIKNMYPIGGAMADLWNAVVGNPSSVPIDKSTGIPMVTPEPAPTQAAPSQLYFNQKTGKVQSTPP